MPEVHFIERVDILTPVDKPNNEWESGNWAISEDTAKKLVGGHIYPHRNQDKPSHFGGEILSYRFLVDGEHAGRIIFRFRADIACKGVKTGPDGWGYEKKILW